MPADNEFGHWTTLEERLEELRNRLVAWEISGNQLPEIFDTAAGNFAAALPDIDEADPFLLPPTLLLEAFERALDSFDAVLAAFPQTLRCPECHQPLDQDNYCLTGSCTNYGRKAR